MPRIVFIGTSGPQTVVDAAVGETIMDAARKGGVDGIVGDCGGYLNCATCHGYVEAAWMDLTPPLGDAESQMLDCAFDRRANSRLLCQIAMSDALDGVVIHVPERQT